VMEQSLFQQIPFDWPVLPVSQGQVVLQLLQLLASRSWNHLHFSPKEPYTLAATRMGSHHSFASLLLQQFSPPD
jgi:hypothetical protein